MSDITIAPKTKCPKCLRAPSTWRERPAHGSRELYWIGCRECSHLAGGVNPSAALMQWERIVARWKFDQTNRPRA